MYIGTPFLPAFFPFVGRWYWLDAIDENVAFVLADLHAVTSTSVVKSFSKLGRWSFFFTAPRQVNVVRESQSPLVHHLLGSRSLVVGEVSELQSVLYYLFI